MIYPEDLKMVYIAGPYMGTAAHDGSSYAIIEQNIINARNAAIKLVNAGLGIMCPHTHSAHFELWVPDATPDYWYAVDLRLMDSCNILFYLPGKSTGVEKEKEYAEIRGMPIYSDLNKLILDYGTNKTCGRCNRIKGHAFYCPHNVVFK